MKSFSLENEHFDDLIPGTPEYAEYVQGATSTTSLVDQAVMMALEGDAKPMFTSDQEGYFGVTFLKLGSYGAHLVVNRTLNDFTGLYFDKAEAHYESTHQALTVEGVATKLSTPRFAVESLSRAAELAREMDELAKPFASLDSKDEK